ncbi:MAG: 16S rRNA (adenine(1518)-N(6)/adenine(1519)-N(6))-dimethyltransferase RsmA [Planctomycetota bacterium]
MSRRRYNHRPRLGTPAALFPMAQTLSEIKQLLAGHGLRPKHKFGQNFLHDGNHMRRIMDAADIGQGDLVLEVGPGTGALTERLLEVGADVVAVEIDADMQAVLSDRLGSDAVRFTLIVGDVLAGKHTVSPAVVEALAGRPFKLIANLPYNVASPLLANLVVDHPAMSDAVVMIQKEVAGRLTAAPGGKDYGPLGILIQALCEVRTVGVLPPSCFWPAPKVASAVVHLERRAEPMTDDPAALSATLQKLFTKRRKQLGSILGRDIVWPEGIDADARPESLAVEQLIALSKARA